MSKINYIYYGDGDIKIKSSTNIKAFDIRLDGVYDLQSYNPNNFLINYNNNRVLGVGLGSMLGEDAFLKYTGDLKIITCKVVTSENEMINLIPKLTRRDKFNCVRNDFDGENLKFEDLNKVGVVGKIPSKKTVNIITKNFNTKGNQFLLNNKDYIGDYHIHHTGVAMTGAEHTKDSEVLELRDRERRLNNIKNVVRAINTPSTTSSRGGGY
tara:strand:- start:1562 stop:2194 length:633 start_codon:yes stop_codon:yes gene_type:complete